jgi:DNA-binding NarL/FixJ family response regulator
MYSHRRFAFESGARARISAGPFRNERLDIDVQRRINETKSLTTEASHLLVTNVPKTVKLRVLLADDHQLVRDALRLMLELEPDIEVVAQATTGTDVPRLARQMKVDVVCMDIAMPGMNGIETTERLLASCPDIKVVGLSAYVDQRFILDMLQAGATGYVTKADAGEELLRAIRAVCRHQTYLCPAAAAAVTGAMLGNAPRGGIRNGQLGARERQVLQLVAEGHTSPGIAQILHIAPSTVEVHRRNLMRKLNLHNVAELTTYALGCGLVGGQPVNEHLPTEMRAEEP